jgi:hypothetical protein
MRCDVATCGQRVERDWEFWSDARVELMTIYYTAIAQALKTFVEFCVENSLFVQTDMFLPLQLIVRFAWQ